MMKSLLTRWKSTRPFKDFYTEWITTLKTTLLPPLTQTLSSPSPDPLLLSTHVDILHTHFRSYFSALDLASNDDVSLLLYPDFRNSLEKPFLWLGDFHPYIFTNLLRSFLEDDDDVSDDETNDGQGLEFLGKSWNVVMAWKNQDDSSLRHKVEQMECTLRLMVPSIVSRAREAQLGLVSKLGVGWAHKVGDLNCKEHVGQVLVDQLTCVFLDANRLRRSVLADIMGALNVYQAALFLQRLALFYVGFRESKLLSQFKKSKLTLD